MANYNVGNIEVGVISSTSAVASDIDKLIKTINKIERLDKAIQDSFVSINKLGNGLVKIQKINLSQLTTQFNKISSSTQVLNEKLSNIKNCISEPKTTDKPASVEPTEAYLVIATTKK